MSLWPIFPSDRMDRSSPSGKGENGIALILAVVSVFLLTVAVFQTRAGVDLAEEIAIGAGQEMQAFYMARSGLALVSEGLAEDEPEVDSYQDDWALANEMGAVPIAEVGWVIGRVSDEEGKFNVLDLVNPDGESDGYSDFGAERLLVLLDSLGIEESRADVIVDSLIDWMDRDETVTGSGAETIYYESLDNPYSCPNDIPSRMDELALVKGIGPTLLYHGEGDVPPLMEYITIYGDRSSRPGNFRLVNLNTAPVEVIMSLIPGMSRDVAEEVAAWRDEEPFETAGDIENVPGFPYGHNDDIDQDVKLSDLIDVSSGHFSARIIGETTGASSKVYGVFERRGSSVELVYYRGF